MRTEIGYFVDRVWLTEGIRPGVVACSHHHGRWRRRQDVASNRFSANVVEVTQPGPGKWLVRQIEGPGPFARAGSGFTTDLVAEGGVPQNLTFPVQPDPISGMHCWHQKVTLHKTEPGDRYGEMFSWTLSARTDLQLAGEDAQRPQSTGFAAGRCDEVSVAANPGSFLRCRRGRRARA